MALDSAYTGIVDWRLVALRYGQDFEEAGGTVVTESEVSDISMVKESPAGSTEGEQPLLSTRQHRHVFNTSCRANAPLFLSAGMKYPIAIRDKKVKRV